MRRIRARTRCRALGIFLALMVGLSLTARTHAASAQASAGTSDPPPGSEPGTPRPPAEEARASAARDVDAPAAPLDPYDQLIDGGVAEFASGHWVEARTLFERAHLLRPSARTLRALGMSAFNLHRYAQAVAELEAAQRHPEQPLDPSMQVQAAELLRRAASLVGRFTLTLAPPDGVLRVDEGPPVRDPDGRVLLDIGQHQLALEAPGYATAKEALEVHGGEDAARSLRALPLAAKAEAAQSTRPRKLSRRAVLALSLASVGLAVAAGGLASWMRASHRYDELDARCRARGGCLPGTVDFRPVHRLENASYGLAGAGGAMLMGGGTLGAFELFRRPARAAGATMREGP